MKIEKQIKKACANDLKDSISRVQKMKNMDDLNMLSWLKSMLTAKELTKDFVEIKKILIKKLEKKSNKKLQEKLEKLEKIQSQDDFKGCSMSITWHKSRTWGNCPRGTYKNFYFYKDFSSVTGCGYDKLSALTADMLNIDLNLMKFIINYIEKYNVNKDNIQNKLSYGIRMSFGMPYFEGGVGIECHIKILKKMGLKVSYVSGDMYDNITIDL